MARNRRLPAAYSETEAATLAAEKAPTGRHAVELTYAEPSPMGLFFQRFWRRTVLLLKVGVAVCALAAYPVMTITAHSIDDSAITLSASENWAFPEAGVSITKIARELQGTGWAGDRAQWHPQARLTAMPAWQAATANALSEHTHLIAKLVPGTAGEDSDLAAAARLLATEPGADMKARLGAAAEALNRFDSRVARGLVALPSRAGTLQQEAALFANWARADRDRLSRQIDAGSADLPATRRDIEAFYAAKARAHVAAQMLAALEISDPKLARHPNVAAALARAETAWSRASRLRPLFVANQAGDSVFAPNHLSSLGFFLGEAEDATADLALALAAIPGIDGASVASVQPELVSAAP
jgi:hypothetical protein